MIDAPALLKALQKLLKGLEDNLRDRVSPASATTTQEEAVATELDQSLRAQFREARDAGRTAQTFESWRDELLTQVAVAWILGCVFVRFLEDNGLVETPLLSGPDNRRQKALDQRELYFRVPERKTHSDREYLLHVFEEMRKLPAARELFAPDHNPLFIVGPSGDGATQLLQFWQRVDPETGSLDHDFSDPDWSTRFLGDLYQDLSEAAKKRYALLQTPEFVEEFILDRTLTPAIEEYGFQTVRLIDPTCGSGHFLLGAFHRLIDLWVRSEPGANPRELVQRSLDQVYGVDVNPFAVAIARFRLLVEALRLCGIKRLSDAPAFHENLAVGDSLLHGRRPGLEGARQEFLEVSDDPLRHVYQTEDADALRRILGQQYHAVVGNPPYITVKDKARSQAYREAYSSCHRQYSLGVPFTQRFFELAVRGADSRSAGFVGMITANSFMKREFGTKLIQETLPKLDLTHVIDTSGAYIPGHGTPTVILLGRNQRPIGDNVRAAMGIRGEPEAPKDASKGKVWLSILDQLDRPRSENEFISVNDYERDRFSIHPWSLSGGGAVELKELLETATTRQLKDVVKEIGRTTHTGEDAVFFLPRSAADTRGFQDYCVPLVVGEDIRDFQIKPKLESIFPYTESTAETWSGIPNPLPEHFWRYRTNLRRRMDFGQHIEERGLRWFEHSMFFPSRYLTPLSIAFAFVATHNHFVLDRGGKVFSRSAPVIKLPSEASEDDHLNLLAVLNSSTACFWMKQVFHNKGDSTDSQGARLTAIDSFANTYEFTGTGLQEFPLPDARMTERARVLSELGDQISCWKESRDEESVPDAATVSTKKELSESALRAAIAAQEELDWACYQAYGLLDESLCLDDSTPPPLELGQRAFEFVLARRMAVGDTDTTWFERHGSIPITELPKEWPEEYRRLVERRIDRIESDRNIRLIEQPEYKRRWNVEPFDAIAKRQLRDWLLDWLEAEEGWSTTALQTTAQLADRADDDPAFMQVAELYTGRTDFDASELVRELVEGESVPILPVVRYKPAGLRKRAQWERTWRLQRLEDEIDTRTTVLPEDPAYLSESDATRLKAQEVGEISVPPRYTPGDFQKTGYWRLRGKLDVPKERFVSFPHCERGADHSLVVGWAGWSHLELAQAIAAYYLEVKDQEGWPAERLIPLLLALLETLPWLKQWNNEVDPQIRIRMGDYFETFVGDEARELGLDREQLEAWTPTKQRRSSRAAKKLQGRKESG